MSRRTFLILSVLEVLFFILDVGMRWRENGMRTHHFLSAWLPIIFLALCIPLLVLLYRSYAQIVYHNMLALHAILLGMSAAVSDVLRVDGIIDWMHVGDLWFNGGDILIIGGVIGIILVWKLGNSKPVATGN